MEKVYVLTETVSNYSCEYGCNKERIVGVFTSFEKMDEYIKNHPTASWAFHDYEEFDVIKWLNK